MSLTTRAYLLATLFVLLGIAGQWLGGGWEALWRLPAVAFLIGFWAEGQARPARALSVSASHPAQIALGDRFMARIAFDNTLARSVRMRWTPRLGRGLIGEEDAYSQGLAAGETIGHDIEVHARELGSRHLGIVYTRVRGRLGLAWWHRRIALDDPIEVVPARLAHRERGVGVWQLGARPRPHHTGAGVELWSLRDYQVGDPLRAIDWKATARSGRHQVRVFTQEQRMEIVLAIDCGRSSRFEAGGLSRLHWYVNTAARLCELAQQQGDAIGLVTFSHVVHESIGLERTAAHLRRVRTALTRLRAEGRVSNPLVATLALRRMLRHRGLVVIFSDIEDPEAAEQLLRAAALLSPKHLPLVASLVDEDIMAMGCKPVEHWLDPYRRFAAAHYARAVRQSALTLRRGGAEVVLAPAADLDARILRRYVALRSENRV